MLIAISACLLGENVRYDGGNKLHQPILDALKGKVEFIPFCPEVSIGLGVPRKKIQAQIVPSADTRFDNSYPGNRSDNSINIRIVGVLDHQLDVTEALQSYAKAFLEKHPAVTHFIVKAKSPSCGYYSTPLNKQGEAISFTSGMFTRTISMLKPELNIIEETSLATAEDCQQFVETLNLGKNHTDNYD